MIYEQKIKLAKINLKLLILSALAAQLMDILVHSVKYSTKNFRNSLNYDSSIYSTMCCEKKTK